jgi:hypothetical protein
MKISCMLTACTSCRLKAVLQLSGEAIIGPSIVATLFSSDSDFTMTAVAQSRKKVALIVAKRDLK